MDANNVINEKPQKDLLKKNGQLDHEALYPCIYMLGPCKLHHDNA